ncbi:MAG TPA: class I SAM-dependent methyltransferase [Actinomycetota bacterium]|nr:class I SAM-dependent methyltransferase [Actinomycetota bacterium]
MSRTLPAYTDITERIGSPMSGSQIAMANTRYRFAEDHSKGLDVLEIGCGTGFGLPYLVRTARTLIGGDIDWDNVSAAGATGVPVIRFDAHRLPFASASADTVLLFESIYYLRDPALALQEVHRVLRPGGEILICLPNVERPGFHPSPFSVSYPTAAQLGGLLRHAGYEASIYGAFPVGDGGPAQRLYLAAATIAVRLRIIPRTLRGRAKLKRVLFGRLPAFAGVDGITGVQPLDPLDPSQPVRRYTNLYAVGRKQSR